MVFSGSLVLVGSDIKGGEWDLCGMVGLISLWRPRLVDPMHAKLTPFPPASAVLQWLVLINQYDVTCLTKPARLVDGAAVQPETRCSIPWAQQTKDPSTGVASRDGRELEIDRLKKKFTKKLNT